MMKDISFASPSPNTDIKKSNVFHHPVQAKSPHFSHNYAFCVDYRLSHFDYVKVEDLEKIGMGKPAVRRLLDAIKRKKATLRKKGILEKVVNR